MHYILSREIIEKISKEILSEYKPILLTTPQALDVYDFADYLGLTTEIKYLSEDESILGLTSFNDGIYFVYEDDRKTKYPIEVKKDTIIIENSLLLNPFEGRERYTVTHECSHQILHKPYFLRGTDSANNGIAMCAKRDV